jgi:hypothetical protein
MKVESSVDLKRVGEPRAGFIFFGVPECGSTGHNGSSWEEGDR